jgi:hypothetical protein
LLCHHMFMVPPATGQVSGRELLPGLAGPNDCHEMPGSGVFASFRRGCGSR